VYANLELVSVANSSYQYSGGVHGNYGTTFYVFDLKKKRQLVLSDILNPSDSAAVSVLLEDKFRKAYNLKPTDKLSEILFGDSIWPNDNFYVTGKGIGFNYVPYEIGPYSSGEIRLFIPFKELLSILQKDFLRLVQSAN